MISGDNERRVVQMSSYIKPMFLWNECAEGVWAANLSSGNPAAAFSTDYLGPEFGANQWTGGGQAVINIDLTEPKVGNRVYFEFGSGFCSFWMIALNGSKNAPGATQGCVLCMNDTGEVRTMTIAVNYVGDVPPAVIDVKVKTE